MNKEQILYEDNDIIVCHKPAGIATQTAGIGRKDMVSEVSNHIKAPIRLVHRLDQPVEGILVFAKTGKAAAELSRQIADNRMEKYYCAVVCINDNFQKEDNISNRYNIDIPGDPYDLDGKEKEHDTDAITLTNYLFKDNKTNISHVVCKEKSGARIAKLQYTLLDKRPLAEVIPASVTAADLGDRTCLALARIKLITGRHHQIRVQMSHAGMSLLGDYKYADEKTKEISEMIGIKQIALCAYGLIFYHPRSGAKLSFCRQPENGIFSKLSFQNFSL